MARTGSAFEGSSGDYALAFATSPVTLGRRATDLATADPATANPAATDPTSSGPAAAARPAADQAADPAAQDPAAAVAAGQLRPVVSDDELDPLFAAAMNCTEEAILNSLCMAQTMTGYRGHVMHAVPLDALRRG
jgi:L-aminopeptidase/D-esterase-like protein